MSDEIHSEASVRPAIEFQHRDSWEVIGSIQPRRFVLFITDISNPNGGAADIEGSYDTLDEINPRIDTLIDKEPRLAFYDVSVLDTQTGQIYGVVLDNSGRRMESTSRPMETPKESA